MLTAKQILDTLQSALPGGYTNKELAEKFGAKATHLAVRTGTLLKQGRVTRSKDGSTATNIAIYRYYFKSSETQATKKREEPLKNAKESPAPKATRVVTTDFESLLEQLSQSLAQQIVAKVKPHIAKELNKMLPAPTTTHKEEILPSYEVLVARCQDKPTAPSRKPKVLVVGLLPQQAGVIQQDLCDALNIDFWNTGEGTDRLKAKSRSADMVFTHIQHMGHATEALIKSVGAEITRVPGGLGQVKQALMDYYKGATNGIN